MNAEKEETVAKDQEETLHSHMHEHVDGTVHNHFHRHAGGGKPHVHGEGFHDEHAQAEGEALVALVGKVVSEKIGPLIVTPKDIDCIVARSAALLAMGIDLALHGLCAEELRKIVR